MEGVRLRRLAIVLCAALVSLTGCAQGPLHEKHPLQDTILDAASGNTFPRSRLVDEMSTSDVVYLGEKHDNTEHHRHQLWILETLVARGQRPQLGLEVFPVEQTPALMEFVLGKSAHGTLAVSEQRLRASLGWGSSRDETWRQYGPLLRAAREHGLTVFGVDLPVALRRRISRVGVEGLTPVEREQVPEAGTVAPAYRAAMLDRLRQSHCGHGSEPYLDRLFQNWKARNETMARTVATATRDRARSPVLVVLGGAHVRHGEGVVPRVRARSPGVRQLIVSFEEADPRYVDPRDYVAVADRQEQPAATHLERIWLTAQDGLTADAACKRFGKALKKHG